MKNTALQRTLQVPENHRIGSLGVQNDLGVTFLTNDNRHAPPVRVELECVENIVFHEVSFRSEQRALVEGTRNERIAIVTSSLSIMWSTYADVNTVVVQHPPALRLPRQVTLPRTSSPVELDHATLADSHWCFHWRR